MTKTITKRVRKSSKKVAPAALPVLMIASPESFKAADMTRFERLTAPVIADDVELMLADLPDATDEELLQALTEAEALPALENVEVTETELSHLEHTLSIAAMLEGDEETAEELPAAGIEVVAEQPQDFAELRDGFSPESVILTKELIGLSLDSRRAFEVDSDPENLNIHRTLKKVGAALHTDHAAKVMLACAVDPAFINREVNTGSRFNVYALDKLTDVIGGLTGAFIQNKINLAVMRSLFACRKAGIEFTGELARAAASDKLRVSAALKGVLVRHTVSASTAPTQASSTMSALATLGIVKQTGSRKTPVYHLTDHPAVQFLEQRLAA